MVPEPPPLDAPAALVVSQALVAYAQTKCSATRVDVHSLGVETSNWTVPYSIQWSGDPCAARPDLMLSVSTDGTTSKKMTVRPHLTAWVNAPLAAHDMDAGAAVEAAWGEVPVESLARQPIAQSGIARVRIRQGEPLTRMVVSPPLDLVQGASVSLIVRRGALTVTADGTSLHDARIGDTVRVVNSATKTTLQGVLVDAKTVEIR